MPSVSIVMNTYNNPQDIDGLFGSIESQTLQPTQVIVIDNSDTSEVAEKIAQVYPQAQVHKQKQNLDFCKGANLGISLSTSEYVFLINSDVELSKTAIEDLVAEAERYHRAGAIAPKLYRLQEGKRTTTIDGFGLKCTRAHVFTNIGEGEDDAGQYDDVTDVFGISGAAVLYRKEALQDIAAHGGGQEHEYLDADYLAYKDDIDVSYRLRHRGWDIRMHMGAIVYHKRTAKELKNSEGVRKDRKAKSLRVRTYSMRNHWWTLLKNEPFINLILFAPWIFTYECAKFFFVVLFEPSTLKMLPYFFRNTPKIIQKRRAILFSSVLAPKDLRSWFR